MNRYRSLPLIAGLCTAALACLGFAGSAPAQNVKIAVASPARIFQELKETNDLKATMEAQQKQLQNQEMEKRQQIKDLQAARDALKPDSAQYAERNRELMQKTIEFETWGKVQQIMLQSEQKRQMLNIFVKIRSGVQKVATAKGIDIVLAEQRPDFEQMNLDQINVEQLRALINTQNILFHSAQSDISDEVIATMDAEYKSGK